MKIQDSLRPQAVGGHSEALNNNEAKSMTEGNEGGLFAKRKAKAGNDFCPGYQQTCHTEKGAAGVLKKPL